MRVLLHLAAVTSVTLVAGCGPMKTPLPIRFDDDAQQKAEVKWNEAFTPAGRLDRQSLLDAFLVTQAYQVGVDRLTLRSEKKLVHGRVEMEINFERLKPENDCFEVRVWDDFGQVVRQER